MTAYRGRTLAFYLLLVVGLSLIVTGTLRVLIPTGVAVRIGHNSESLLFAITFCATAQFLLPWIRARRWSPWIITVPGAVLCFCFGYIMINSGWPASIVTLNEPVIATGFMLLYASIRRPFRYAPLVAAAILILIVIAFRTGFVLDQAESLVPALLAPLALDVFDRTILEPERKQGQALRLVWMALLLVIALALIPAAEWAREDLHGPIRLGIDYAQRAAEAYWGWLIVHAYFGYWIGTRRGWRRTPSNARHAEPSPSIKSAVR
ncbi:hypothetical protein [Microlunatus sp. Gsoil 973]|uniref:hypothetical protein n=1 Tax=Microlunatus sp. Gsoil 973 TaxID=2672569 RepID=UPI0012B48A34|nr:hypothetical protein [Microlunatus sp. Gsoil 973]QGN33896.1 hypothetical protein GJV80_14955 [Microlunatus sp. Gsoil 973]